MNSRAQIRFLPDGKRLHLQDGPIDLIIEAFGPLAEIEKAYRAGRARFETVLDELCRELSFLRQPCSPERFFFQAEDGIRDLTVTGVQTCALPILTKRDHFYRPTAPERTPMPIGSIDRRMTPL